MVDHPWPDVAAGRVSTGRLPGRAEVGRLVTEAYAAHRGDDTGSVATYIPTLAKADPDACAVSVVSVAGESVEAGDVGTGFSIQSVSKPFVLALVHDALGPAEVHTLLGVNATGMPFNSVMAVELNEQRTMNPMVNAGAIATTSLALRLAGADRGADAAWGWLHEGLSRFAGRDLDVDEEVYDGESRTNGRNRGIAHLLHSYGRVYSDPDVALDLYTRQCSLRVDVHDLAVMGATLADGGVNPVTGVRVVSADTCARVLAVMATAGLYELSGDWLHDIGLPGKSGVSGAIVTVAPGKGGMATWSPRLDAAGNSVRGQLITRDLSAALGLNLFSSRPVPPVAPGDPGTSVATGPALSSSSG
ncbi:glutaminase [Intrasporangium oryzae NRRL B-24470]|uniref:Glutaminase n=1 Tax=Intrasporangium oryzae NRRL B-24470 TaxID=1386089 RepID=W9GC85_9MICO|nr:glutaminase A [Intrasporangium oryzae]EWT02428.1 glutaminase [Intrasporangium oryzae NRRL B-24470]